MMTRFERWLLKKLCKRLVQQGPYHEYNITQYYSIMTEAAKREFYEDNVPTLNGFLTECFEKSIDPESFEYISGTWYVVTDR